MPLRKRRKYTATNRCVLDDTPCIRCDKCSHMPKQSGNRFTQFLIALIVIVTIVFVLNPIIMMGIEKHHNLEQSEINDSNTLDNKMQNYNEQNDYHNNNGNSNNIDISTLLLMLMSGGSYG